MASSGASRNDPLSGDTQVGRDDRQATWPGDLYAAIVQSACDAILTCRPDMTITTWNPSSERLFGYAAREALSKDFLVLTNAEDQGAMRAAFTSALAGNPVVTDTMVRARDGERLDVSLALTPLHEGETIVGIAAIIRDTRRRRRAEAADHMLATIVRHSSDAVLSIDTERRIAAWNPAAERLYGYTAQEVLGRPVSILVPENRRSEIDGMYQSVLGEGETVQFDTQRQRRDGTLVDVSISGAPLLAANGDIFGISLIHRDITEQRRQNEQTRFIMRELAHRSKNLLAIILSMASQTARSARTLPDFTARFTQRLQGLSYSHDLLLQRDWRGVSMLELAERQLQHFVDGEAARVSFTGPMVMVDPKAAQNLGLALHELATNASKYGALSSQSGRVALTWSIVEGRFRVEWKEFGGPPVTPPQSRGFGQVVLERLASDALEGQVSLDYAPEGFVWSLNIPASYLVDATPEATSS